MAHRKPYYTLVVKWEEDGKWMPEFGDYDKAVVTQEIEDSYSSEEVYKTRIVRTEDDLQASLIARLEIMNL